MTYEKASVRIFGHWNTVDKILSTINNGLPRDDKGATPCVEFDLSMKVGEDSECEAKVTYIAPDPRPDIPALIKAWHAEPTDANREILATAIRNDGRHKPSYYPSYQTKDATYWVDNNDSICVGPYFDREG